MSASDKPAASPPAPAGCDFFVSYTGKDKAWAEWIAWQLENAGYRTLIQAWDFKSGGVFPGDMHRALIGSARVLAVLSPDYMDSAFCLPEWQAAFADDPTGEKGKLVCIRVVDFKPDGLLRGRTYIDLVGLSPDDANSLLLERLKQGRAKPVSAPSFPGAAPAFPGVSSLPSVPTTAIPHNLPRLQPFFGREDELATIAAAHWAAAKAGARERAFAIRLRGLGHQLQDQALVRQGRAAEARPHALRAVEIFETLRTPGLAAARDTLAECQQAAAPD